MPHQWCSNEQNRSLKVSAIFWQILWLERVWTSSVEGTSGSPLQSDEGNFQSFAREMLDLVAKRAEKIRWLQRLGARDPQCFEQVFVNTLTLAQQAEEKKRSIEEKVTKQGEFIARSKATPSYFFQ